MSLAPAIFIGAACVVVYYLYKRWRDFHIMWKYMENVPGPKGVPIFGSMLDVLGNPEQLFAKSLELSSQYRGLFKIRIAYTRPRTVIYNPQDVEIVLNNMTHITKGQLYDLLHEWLGSGLLTSTGSKWQKMRKILTPAFHFSILNEFLEIFNRETEHLVKTIKGQPSQIVDVVAPVTEYTLASIGETSLGVQISKEPNSPKYKEAIYEFGEGFAYKLTRPWLTTPFSKYLFARARKDKEYISILHNFSNSVIQKRKKQVEADIKKSVPAKKKLALLDLLLKVRYKEGVNIDDKSIQEEIDTFVFEGHDTTAVSLSFTLLALANEPKIQEEIYQEMMDIMGDDKKVPDSNDIANMMFLERCVKESLRLYPSVPIISRMAGEDFKTHDGYNIKKGSDLMISIYSMHHSPDVWEDPEKFDPDRFLPENIASRHPYAYIPFSAGPRNCIGQKYALYELKAGICGILRNFKLEPVDNPADVKIKQDLVLRSNDPMRVKFIPRK